MKRKLFITITVVVVAFIGWLLYGMFGPNPQIVVSKETTWLTEPLADDGLPDYATWLLDQQREGVTPENNAAIPLLQAMWTGESFAVDAMAVFDALDMAMPESNSRFAILRDWESEVGLGWRMWCHVLNELGVEDGSALFSYDNYTLWLQRQDEYEFNRVTEDDSARNRDDELCYRAIRYCERVKESIFSEPWKRERMPLVARWVDRNSTRFELLHQAAQRDRFYLPDPELLKCTDTWAYGGPSLDRRLLVDASTALEVRARMYLGEADAAAVWRDTLAIYKLANARPLHGISNLIIRGTLQTNADSIARQILASDSLDRHTAEAIYKFYAQSELKHPLGKCIDQYERVVALQLTLVMSRELNAGSVYYDEYLGIDNVLAVDWNVALKVINEWYDRLLLALDAPNRAKRDELIAAIVADINSLPEEHLAPAMGRQSRGERVGNSIARISLSNSEEFIQFVDNYLDSGQLLRIASALAVHRCKSGSYPDSLETLVPNLLPELPVDNYTGMPLVYTTTDDGYLLVNLGPDGRTSGGSHQSREIFRGIRDANDTQLDMIPAGADDIAIRVPQPPKKWPELAPGGGE